MAWLISLKDHHGCWEEMFQGSRNGSRRCLDPSGGRLRAGHGGGELCSLLGFHVSMHTLRCSQTGTREGAGAEQNQRQELWFPGIWARMAARKLAKAAVTLKRGPPQEVASKVQGRDQIRSDVGLYLPVRLTERYKLNINRSGHYLL